MKDGGPAYPQGHKWHLNGCDTPIDYGTHGGMTLRDYFAAAALTGLCASVIADKQRIVLDGKTVSVGELAFAIADGALAARKGPDEGGRSEKYKV